MSDLDPENAKHEFAFDNPAFKSNFQRNFIILRDMLKAVYKRVQRAPKKET